ncbi:MAG: hypothetical protein KDB23_32630, partial [Planctomycetales bacterium]|nr:hypothetical protein [Planctomycetales bacterium]
MIHYDDRRDALLSLRVRRRNLDPEPAAEVAFLTAVPVSERFTDDVQVTSADSDSTAACVFRRPR